MAAPDYSKYLPLSEATYYILVALDEPLHGYAIMQKVEAMSEGTVVIGPGTLYGAFSTLEKQGLIAMVKEEARRKYYALTERGREVLAEQLRRLHIMVRNGKDAAASLKKEGAA
ncbi:PadR family transcriptional regulator [Massilia niabensis]|uniref:PadR family transcriptional regulator n=1 Tax=Massilia niabensis TaxID=544910 RepID=A0ABW0L7F0_9BURK